MNHGASTSDTSPGKDIGIIYIYGFIEDLFGISWDWLKLFGPM